MIWWHQRLAHGTTSFNERELVAGLTWMDSGKLLALPFALIAFCVVALRRSLVGPRRFADVACVATLAALAALAVGTALQFWRFEWGSYAQELEDAEVGVGGAIQAAASPAFAVAFTAFAVALARERVLPAWGVPVLAVSALATFWLTPTNPLPGLSWLVLAAAVRSPARRS